MKNNIQFLHDLMAKIDGRLDDIYEVQVKQEASLAEHIRRTELIEEELKPIRRHVYAIQGVGALLGVLALFASIYAAVK